MKLSQLKPDLVLPTSVQRVVEWRPNPGPQSLLFVSPAELILYGGARGGGKTSALIMMCFKDWAVDGYKALILRRNYTELERHIIPETRRLFRDIGHYSEKTHRWTFRTPSGGESTLEFGYLESPRDLDAYQGSQYARIGFDESTSFSEYEIRTLYACLRSPVPNVRRQMLLTCNPVGSGFHWHKKLFHVEDRSCRVYTDPRWPSDGEPIHDSSTCFIPARVWDNPALLSNDPNYPSRLRSQYGPLADAMLDGSWAHSMHLAFDFDEAFHVETPPEFPTGTQRWMAIDWGVGDKASTTWLAEYQGRVWCYREYSVPGREIVPYAQYVLSMTPSSEEIQYCVLSHECFAHRGASNTQAEMFARVFAERGIPVQQSDRDPEGRMMLLREYLRTTPSHRSEFQGDYKYWMDRLSRGGRSAENELIAIQRMSQSQFLPKLKISPACVDLIHNLPLLVVDPIKPSKLADGQDDHSYDSLTYGLKFHIFKLGVDQQTLQRHLLDSSVPESPFQAELAQNEARRLLGDVYDTLQPVKWPMARHDSWRR